MPFRRRDPGINAGHLDKRVTLLAPVFNEFQDEITDWQPAAQVWAQFDPNYEREGVSSGRTVALGDTSIIIRYRTDIDERWRIQFGQRIFHIEGIVNPLERNEQLTLNCQEVK